MHRELRAREFERDLQASATRPGLLTAGPWCDQRQRVRPLARCDGGEQRNPFRAHRQAQRNVLDDHPRHDIAGSGQHRCAGPELRVRGMGTVTSPTSGGDEIVHIHAPMVPSATRPDRPAGPTIRPSATTN